MIEQPERQLPEFAKAGADSCTVHVEACPHLHHTIPLIHELGLKAGVTLNPATPTAALAEAARYADLLLCMSVNPGWGGQSFIEASVERLGQLGDAAARHGARGRRRRRPATIGRVHEAGANLLVAGSAIYGQPSPGEAYRALVAAVP